MVAVELDVGGYGEGPPDSEVVLEGDDHAADGLGGLGHLVLDVAHVALDLPNYRVAGLAPLELHYKEFGAILAHGQDVERACVMAEGLSPRAGLALVQAARAWALLDGRNHVLPDDVQAVLTAVAGHRLRPAKGGGVSHRARAEMVAELLKAVAVP